MDAFPSMRRSGSGVGAAGGRGVGGGGGRAIAIRRQTQSLLLPFSLLIARFVFVWREIELGSFKLKSRVRSN